MENDTRFTSAMYALTYYTYDYCVWEEVHAVSFSKEKLKLLYENFNTYDKKTPLVNDRTEYHRVGIDHWAITTVPFIE